MQKLKHNWKSFIARAMLCFLALGGGSFHIRFIWALKSWCVRWEWLRPLADSFFGLETTVYKKPWKMPHTSHSIFWDWLTIVWDIFISISGAFDISVCFLVLLFRVFLSVLAFVEFFLFFWLEFFFLDFFKLGVLFESWILISVLSNSFCFGCFAAIGFSENCSWRCLWQGFSPQLMLEEAFRF